MEIKKYEDGLIAELETVVNDIITETPKLDIAVKKGERVGDAISKFFEDNFVTKTQATLIFQIQKLHHQEKPKTLGMQERITLFKDLNRMFGLTSKL